MLGYDKHSLKHNEKGIAMITVMLMMAIMTALAVTMFNTSYVETLISSNYRTSKEAFFDADAGVQYALARVKAELEATDNSIDDVDGINLQDYTVSGFNFELEAVESWVPDDNPYCFKSIGKVLNPSGHKTVAKSEVEACLVLDYAKPFDNAMTGCEGVKLIGNAVVDSYNSSQGPYAVSKSDNGTVTTTNIDSDIEVTGNAIIKGDALAVGDVNSPEGAVTGNIGEKEEELCDPLDIISYVADNDPFPNDSANNDIKNSQTLDVDDFPIKIGDIDLKGNNTLTIEPDLGHVTMFVEGDLSIGGNANMEIGPGTYLTIYLKGELDSMGNGIVNLNSNPESLQIFSSNSSANDGVKIGGNGTFVGSIYAPLTNVKIPGNGVFYGALRGKTVKINGNPEFHFDESLKNIREADLLVYKLVSWREVFN
ncbi:MAG: hypothetical protein D5R98_05205 [Desulfonatronovibrio sp. MSAO_Bac4]|nr:MAG: hypothetical protein D5R98_05205 [Desulfonatronovibrio sp. MSAO_Bac4]